MENLTYIEISRVGYYVLMRDAIHSEPVKTIESEHARRVFYKSNGMVLQVIINFLSPDFQYYLADINS